MENYILEYSIDESDFEYLLEAEGGGDERRPLWI